MVDEVGDTFIVLLNDPVLQVYVVAPKAAIVAVSPAHNVGELTVIVGEAFTKTVAVFTDKHPSVDPVKE